MEYRNLGRSGMKVSTLCLGAMTFGEADEKSFMHHATASAETSWKLIDRALDAGINFIDTADVYGQDGLSERVIGDWFERSGRRDQVVLATKCRFRMGEGPNATGAARLRIMRAAEASLQRLKTDRIDLYQIHMQDIDVPIDETLRALDDLVRTGKVLYIGCSNYAAYRLSDALWTSRMQNLERFVSLQAKYSLVTRDLERELVPLCREHGLGILPWSPLEAGFLSGKYRRGQDAPSGTRFETERWKAMYTQIDNVRNWCILDAVKAVASELDASAAQVALAWLLRKPAVTSVIFGARTLDQLEDNLRAAAIDLTSEHVDTLEKASAFELGYPYNFIGNIQSRW